jgi:ABC-type branched-subunit amino acid transport system permease subunit
VNGFFALLRRLEGPQTVGRGPAFWVAFAIVLAIACAYPQFSDGYTVGNTVYFFVWVFIALSLCLIWGYGGSLSFGQTAFFGIAGYGYGILTLNFGSAYGFTLIALLLAVALAALFALLLGYFMFFGRIAGVFLGIVTLAVTLMLERFMAQTAGPEWHVGVARLNGFNGMSAMPPLTIPWPGGDIVLFADIGLYYLVLGLLVAIYLGLRILMNSAFGNVIVAIRENPERAEMLGYDVRKYQLITFVIGAALAALSGVLYTVWGHNTSRRRVWA